MLMAYTICNFILLLCFQDTFVEVNVEWEAKLPAVFGNVTYLQCIISDDGSNCSLKTRQWYGGPRHKPICYNSYCAISNKYEVMQQSRCLYTLMIRNFSEFDVNCDYTCSYGVSQKRRNLSLDERNFIYEPHVEDIQEKITENDKTFNWKINISKIFPTPACGADLKGKHFTDHLKNSVTKPGFYFATDLQIILPLPLCGELDVYCYLGEHKINITSKNFDSCHLQGGNGNKEINVTALVLSMLAVSLVILVTGCCLYRKRT